VGRMDAVVGRQNRADADSSSAQYPPSIGVTVAGWPCSQLATALRDPWPLLWTGGGGRCPLRSMTQQAADRSGSAVCNQRLWAPREGNLALGKRSRVPDTPPKLMLWPEAGEAIGVGAVVATFRSAAPSGCVEGARTSSHSRGVGEQVLSATGLRRRLRGRPHLCSIHVSFGHSRETFPQLGDVAPTSRPGARRGPDARWRPGRPRGRPSDGDPSGRCCSGTLGSRAPTPTGLLAAGGFNASPSHGPDGERRGEGMRVFLWGLRP
jgi:hypothetical protein